MYTSTIYTSLLILFVLIFPEIHGIWGISSGMYFVIYLFIYNSFNLLPITVLIYAWATYYNEAFIVLKWTCI